MPLLKHASIFYLLLLLSAFSASAQALHTVITHAPNDEKDHLQDYVYLVLKAALRASKEKYGAYEFRRAPKAMPRDRQFAELIKGEQLTVIASPPKANWSGKTLQVPFPLQKGISSYRIFLLMDKNKDLLSNVKRLSQLKAFSTGANLNWTTTKILEDHGFNIVKTLGYKNLFDMLARDRFQTFNRGVNEVSIELQAFGKAFPGLTYDQHLVLYTYLPNYFHVTPKQPELAARIEYGLKQMHASGEHDAIFYQFYGQHLAKYRLDERKLFVIENTNLEPGMYERDKPFLLAH